MKTLKTQYLLGLGLIAILDCQWAYASRRLSTPFMRLRSDAHLALPNQLNIFDDPYNYVIPNVSSPLTPPTASNLPIKPLEYIESRFRIELSNISSVSQTVQISLRPGTFGEMATSANNLIVLAGTTQFSAGRVLTTVTLQPLPSSITAADTGSSTSLFFDFACYFNTNKCNYACLESTTFATCPGPALPSFPFTAPSPSTVVTTTLSLGLDVQIVEDTGAISGTVGTIINTTYGYPVTFQGSFGSIPLNGGRPF